MEEQINEARYRLSEEIEAGDLPMVGVNIFREEKDDVDINIFRHASDMQVKRIEYVRNYKKNRDQEQVKRALGKLSDVAGKPLNLFEPIKEAVEAKATLQEVYDAMRQSLGFAIPR